MKQLLEFIPLILFFAVYKLVGIREAAITLVLATIVQFIILKLKYGKIETQQKFVAGAVVFFGTLTAYFNDLEFLKWKVTIIYALFALVLLIAQFGFKKLLIQQFWKNLNLGWSGFFILCMLINIYISRYLSDDIWVDFKSFGIIGMTFVATIITGLYIYRYLPKSEQEQNKE